VNVITDGAGQRRQFRLVRLAKEDLLLFFIGITTGLIVRVELKGKLFTLRLTDGLTQGATSTLISLLKWPLRAIIVNK